MAQKADFPLNANFVENGCWSYPKSFILIILQLVMGFLIDYKENYEKYEENPNTSDIGPFFGWLCNSILCYDEETQLLKTMVHFQSNGQRPMIDLEPCGHKLYQDYSQGISVDEAWEMAHRYYPADKDNA